MFDLKGSFVNREYIGKIKNSTTLKDLNFLKAKRLNKNLIKFDMESDKERLRWIMIKDVEFLRNNGLMDYSLLLAIERREKI